MARVAVSIQTLADEVLQLSPNTTIYFYDNDVIRNSDHDPNDYGVVCACDIMIGHGLDLRDLAQRIVDRRHPECKYVIYGGKIASRKTNWKWVDYHGDSDHFDHIHVSVGVGADGHSQPPYDSEAKWLEDTVGDIFCDKGDKGPQVWALQIALNQIWKTEPGYDGKNICTENSTYDAATCRAVYKILGGPSAGEHYNPTLYWRLMAKYVKINGVPGPEGPQGVKGDKGDTVTLTPGTVLTVTSPTA